VVSTNSPSSVNSSPRALGAPAACLRDRAAAGGADAAARDDLLAGMATFPG
jgi:MoxR-like ATPase